MGLNNDVSIKLWKSIDRDGNGVASGAEAEYVPNSVFVKAGMHYSEFLQANQKSELTKPDQPPSAEEMDKRNTEAEQLAKHKQEVIESAETLKKQGEANIQKYPQKEMAEKFTQIPNPKDPKHPYTLKQIADALEHPDKPSDIGEIEQDRCGGADVRTGNIVIKTTCEGNDRDKDIRVSDENSSATFRLNTMSLKSVTKSTCCKIEDMFEVKYDSKGNLAYVREGKNEFMYESGKLVATKNDKMEASYDSSGTIKQLIDREPLRQENWFKKDEAYKFKFDDKGRKIEERSTGEFDGIGCYSTTVHYDYDSSGNLVKTRLLDDKNKQVGYENYSPKTGNITDSYRFVAASPNGEREKTIQNTYYPTGVIKTSVETQGIVVKTIKYNEQGEKIGTTEKWQ